MASDLPTIAASPLAPAIELVRSVPAEVMAAAMGALAGVTLFAVMVVVLRARKPRAALQAAATDVVIIPPYPVSGNRWVASSPPFHRAPAPPVWPRPATSSPNAGMTGPAFVASSALSARVLAKMGYAVGHPGVVADATGQAQDVEELEVLASSELHALEIGAASALAAPESIPCVLESSPSAIETGPMSVVTVTSSTSTVDRRSPSSSIMAAVPIADLDLDDAPTELYERAVEGGLGEGESQANAAARGVHP